MRLLIVVLAIPALGDNCGPLKNGTHRSRSRDCHREGQASSSSPEVAMFPWETPTNENLIDLSWAYDASTIYWEDNENFDLNISTTGTTAKDFYQADRLCTATHGGTHIDAPRHFHPKRWTLDQIPLRRLFNIPTVIIDVKKKVVKNRGYLLSIRDLQLWENGHGPLPNNSLIIIRTGHHMLWGNREGYFGRITGNSSRVFPSMGAKTARWLIHNRDIVGVGIDSPSIDGYPSLMGHRAFAKKNVYILENLGSHIDQAPKLGTYAFIMPMKIAGASGGPARVLLRVPHSRPKPTTPNPAIS